MKVTTFLKSHPFHTDPMELHIFNLITSLSLSLSHRKDPNECLPMEKTFKIPNVDKVIEEGKKAPTKFRNITLSSFDVEIPIEMCTASGWPSVSGDALKTLAGKVSADFDFIDDAECDFETTAIEKIDEVPGTRGPKESEDTDISAYGTAYAAFGEGQEGRKACHAIAALCEVCSINSLISNFILPLQVISTVIFYYYAHCFICIFLVFIFLYLLLLHEIRTETFSTPCQLRTSVFQVSTE